MKIYLSSAFSNQSDMRLIRDVIHKTSHRVISSWLDVVRSCVVVAQIQQASECLANYALNDRIDIADADVFVMFTGEPSTYGGRHTEFGYALALGKRCVIIGPRENLFHATIDVTQLNDIPQLLQWLDERPCG